MPKYVSQKDDFTCAPRAVLNALKFRGDKEANLKNLKYIIADCKCDKDGSYQEDYIRTLRKYKFKVVKSRSYERVKNHLQNGEGVILSHLDADNEWHCSFWFFKDGSFYGVNAEIDQPVVFMFSHQQFYSYLNNKDEEGRYPLALILT